MEDIFSMDHVGSVGFGMIQEHYIYCALYFCDYSINSTSDDQALDPGGWGIPEITLLRTEEKSLFRDRGAWPTIVHGVARVRHNLVTKPPPPPQP